MDEIHKNMEQKRYAVVYEEDYGWASNMKVLEFSDLEEATKAFDKAMASHKTSNVMLVEILKD